VSVLLGISKPNAFLLSFVDLNKSPSFNETKENDLSHLLYTKLISLFKTIRETIDIGIETENVGKISGSRLKNKEDMLKSNPFSPYSNTDEFRVFNGHPCHFFNSRRFDTLYFLSWMQENGYPIPEELAIEKNGNGKAIWAGHSSKTKQTTTIPVPPETKWHQIHFRIVNPTRIEITTPDGMTPYHPDDLGFTPNIWDLFERFASDIEYSRGNLDCRAGELNNSVVPEYIMTVKSDASRLRRLLKKVFTAIEDNPIIYETNKGYRAEFHITEA
jgi:hypothetical protein